MKRVLSVIVALFVMVSMVWTAGTVAQAQMPAPGPGGLPGPEKPAAAPGAEKGQTKDIEGKIKSVEPSGANTKVALDDGTQLIIPASLKVQRAALKQGATVKASFEEKGGLKVVTNIEVQPGS